jgi:hypothetical protein
MAGHGSSPSNARAQGGDGKDGWQENPFVIQGLLWGRALRKSRFQGVEIGGDMQLPPTTSLRMD